MQWQDHFCIGDSDIDQQHQELFAMADKLKRSLNTNAMYQEMGKALKFIVEYTKMHFEAEEAYMQKVKYPGLPSHRDLHRKLTQDVQGILLKMKQDKHVFPTELIDLTTEMLLNHTLIEDLKIKQHLEQAEKDRQKARMQEYIKYRESVANAMDQAIKMFQKDTITEETCIAKKNAALKALVHFDEPPPIEEIDDRIALIDTFLSKGWIDDDEAGTCKIKLFGNVDIDRELEKRPREKTKLNYLKSLVAKALITDETFNKYAGRFIKKGPKDKNSGENLVHLL